MKGVAERAFFGFVFDVFLDVHDHQRRLPQHRASVVFELDLTHPVLPAGIPKVPQGERGRGFCQQSKGLILHLFCSFSRFSSAFLGLSLTPATMMDAQENRE